MPSRTESYIDPYVFEVKKGIQVMTEEDLVYLDIETGSLDVDAGMVVSIGSAIEDRAPEIMFVKSFNEEKKAISDIFEKIRPLLANYSPPNDFTLKKNKRRNLR